MDYSRRMLTANESLRNSIKVFRAAVSRMDESAGPKQAMEAVEKGIKSITQTSNVEGKAALFQNRLTELLNEQRNIIERHSSLKKKEWLRTKKEEEILLGRYKDFDDEFKPWMTDFLKRHGIRPNTIDRNGSKPES